MSGAGSTSTAPGWNTPPEDVVHVGRRWTMGGWDLPRHPLYNPFA